MGHHRQRFEQRFFPLEERAWFLPDLAVEARVGDRIPPLRGGGLDRREGGDPANGKPTRWNAQSQANFSGRTPHVQNEWGLNGVSQLASPPALAPGSISPTFAEMRVCFLILKSNPAI